RATPVSGSRTPSPTPRPRPTSTARPGRRPRPRGSATVTDATSSVSGPRPPEPGPLLVFREVWAQTLLRPDVEAQASFGKKKPPAVGARPGLRGRYCALLTQSGSPE